VGKHHQSQTGQYGKKNYRFFHSEPILSVTSSSPEMELAEGFAPGWL
jgi:hypothetical protein